MTSKINLTRRSFIVGTLAAMFGAPAFATSDKTGFIFVGASWCPICHRAAPVLKRVSEQLEVPVLVASGDNRPISPFETFVDAREHELAKVIEKYPTTLLFSAQTQGLVGMIEGYKDPKRYIAQLANAYRQIEQG